MKTAIIKIINPGIDSTLIFGVKRIERLKAEQKIYKEEVASGKLLASCSTLILSDNWVEQQFESGTPQIQPYKLVVRFEAILEDGAFDLIVTDCPCYIMNDEGKTIERIN